MELFITFFAGISILFGAAFIRLSHNTEKIEHLSIAMALSALLSLMIFDLLPDVAESAEGIGWVVSLIFVVGGVALLKFLDHLVPDHDDNEKNHDTENAVHIGLISALAVILHNIVEGMTVYSVSLADPRQGFIFAVGIALHNIPMGMLIESTMEKETKTAHTLVLSSVTLSTLFGGLLMRSISGYLSETVIGILVCVATGMIIYIVFLELLPHVLKTKETVLNLIGAAMGVLLVFASSMIG
jgi:ZIP family zinc transporter